MKRFLFAIVILMFLATTALAADYSSDSGIDGWYDVSGSLTTTTRIPAQDSSDTDVLGYITPEDIFGLMDDITFGASSDTSKVWTWDVGATTNPNLTIDGDYFTFNKPVKAEAFVSNASDGSHYLDIGNTSGYTGSSTPSNGWLNYDSTQGRYEYYDGDWDQYLWTSVLMSSWAGSTNLTTLGTVASGTWQANAVGLSYGGTGATDAPSARSNLGLAIGTDVQAYDSDIGTLASGITGLVKGAGDSGGYSAATDGTDYWSPTSLPAATSSQDGYLSSTVYEKLLGSSTNPIEVFSIVIDGGGSAITTGTSGISRIPENMTITGWYAYADQSGSISVSIDMDASTTYPPTTTITGTEPPALSSAALGNDTSVTTWTDTTWVKNDYIKWNVDSASTVTWVKIDLVGYKN